MLCRSYIAGHWLDVQESNTLERRNPADLRDVVSCTVTASPDDAQKAVIAASDSWAFWKAMPLPARCEIVADVVARIVNERDGIADGIRLETGKTRREARAEVDAAAVESDCQLQIYRRGMVEDIAGHHVVHEPVGPALLVTPSNFPLAALLRKLVPALLAGNSVIVKPSEFTPLTARAVFACIDDTPLSAGVANLVLAGPELVAPIIESDAIAAVSITGSTAAGTAVADAIGSRNIRLQAEMGGSNAAVVLLDADLDSAAEIVAEHAFACAGQWCTGTSRVIVEESVYEPFLERLLSRVRAIRVGPGDSDALDMGAMISERHRDSIETAVDKLCSEGAQSLHGGGRPTAGELSFGCFYEPTVLRMPRDRRLPVQELFGPVLLLYQARDSDDALSMANAGSCGLSFSVFTQDESLADRMVSGADAGLCHVNLGTGVRDNALPLFGWNESGRGLPECGRYARDFFTRPKAIYRAG